MQKIFIRYTVVIMTTAIFFILFINFLFSLHTLKTQQFESFNIKTEQVIHTLENNQAELEIMNKNLDEDYLTRAKAAAYVFERQKEIKMNVKEMQYLAKLLNVDELHLIDGNGIIIAASVSKYVGFDMACHKQTRAFMEILESDDEDAYLIQEAQPNAAENKIMKYIGVARKDQKGVVQVGFKPTRQLEAESRNTYEYIFSKFPTDIGEELFVADCKTGEILGHSDGMDQKFNEEYYKLKELAGCTKGEYKKGSNGKVMYVTSTRYEDVLICHALPGNIIYSKLWKTTFSTFIYLLFVEIAVILLLNYLVKRKVVDGIHGVIEDLSAIANGNLDTIVAAKGNQEFEKLSWGINTMVKSIVSISDRISAIIEISGVPLAAFEYEDEVKNVFVTRGLGELLDIPAWKADELFKDSGMFDRYIHKITEKTVEGEKDVFQINDLKYIRIHMTESSGRYLGVVTDVTDTVTERNKLKYENTHDHLTGLYKFQHFKNLSTEVLKKMLHGEVCAVIMLDLDYFKSVNDTFGHDAGDKYLQGFSDVMKSMPENHFITARRSGDEFCMMVYNCGSREDVIGFLDNFYEVLGKTYIELSSTESRTISASAGFAWTSDASINITTLLNHADEALYEMKRHTKGSYEEYKE